MPGSKAISRRRLVAQHLAVACLMLAVVLLLRLLLPSLFLSAENVVGDWLWRVAARSDEERRVVIVDIDEASLARVGPWPWPRERIAELIGRLQAAKAGLVLMDVVFPDPRPDDATLAKAFESGPIVPAQLFAFGRSADVAAGTVAGPLADLACPAEFAHATGFIANARGLTAPLTGHLSPRIDADGTVRYVPALVCLDGRSYPALGVAAFLRSSGAPYQLKLSRPTSFAALTEPAWRLHHPASGLSFPLDEDGNVRVGYGLKRGAFVSLPAADVLEGRFPADWVRGTWVIIGSTAFGLADAVPTPLGGAVGGVEVHAQFIAAALDGRIPYAPKGAPLLQGALCLLGALLLVWLGTRNVAYRKHSRGWRSAVWLMPAGGLILALALFGVHVLALLQRSWWIGFVEGGSALFLTGVALGTLEHARARVEWERLFGHFSSYLSPKVAALLAQAEPSSQIDAERCEITVLVADIRNFSAYVEGRPPEESGSLLHAFFTGCARLVQAHGGEIDQFSGDSVIAIWTASESNPEKASRQALACADAMQSWFADRFPGPPPPGLEPLALGIGVETGPALAGSFGPLERRTYTALGESVTVARRLEALTADVARPILVGEGVAARLNYEGLECIGLFLLEGLRRTHCVWSPPLGSGVPMLGRESSVASISNVSTNAATGPQEFGRTTG